MPSSRTSRLAPIVALAFAAAACACSGDEGSSSGGGSGGSGGSGNVTSCAAPECQGCADCLQRCVCETGQAGACASSCGAGTGGTAGSSAGGAGGSAGSPAGGAAGVGGASGTAGAAGTAGTAGSGGTTTGNVKLIAIGDTGEGNPDQHLVADRMNEKCGAVGGCTAVLLLGDNFYDHGVQGVDDTQWGPKFEDVYDRPNLDGLKFYATLGNHDYGLSSMGKADAQIQYTALPVGTGPGHRPSDKWVMLDRWYDVRLQHVHLFSMDTQDGSSAQKDDMSARIGASNAVWKIVFGHHPRFTSGDHNKDNGLLDILFGMYSAQQRLYCAADMFLTGHDHNMEFIDKGRDAQCPNTFFAISGAGAKTRDSSQPTQPNQLFYDHSIEGLAYLEFTDRAMHFEFIDKNGNVLFTHDYAK